MSSINEQQPEKNHEDLQGEAAGQKMKSLIEKAKVCFFCTHITTGQMFSTRPMSVQKVDDDGTCWFLSASDSTLNEHVAVDSSVQMLFQGSDYSDFLTLYGQVTVSRDKEKIKELWEPIIKTWFTEGVDDPRITVLMVKPVDGYYWDTKHGQFVAFAKRVVGAIIGQTLDDSIEGRVQA